jgi:hypothetical protein
MAQHELSEAYKRDLLGQIQAHREAARAERAEYLEEGKKIRQQQQQEKAVLESVSWGSLVAWLQPPPLLNTCASGSRV